MMRACRHSSPIRMVGRQRRDPHADRHSRQRQRGGGREGPPISFQFVP
ncbi:hypothetical protein SGLAM104S_04401 [Streptomyces glaucescens]